MKPEGQEASPAAIKGQRATGGRSSKSERSEVGKTLEEQKGAQCNWSTVNKAGNRNWGGTQIIKGLQATVKDSDFQDKANPQKGPKHGDDVN